MPGSRHPRTLLARIVAVLAVLCAVLPLAAGQGALYFCTMLERVTSSCCCGPAHEGPQLEPADESPQLVSRRCCEVLSRLEHAAPPAARDGSARVPSPALAVLFAAPELVGVSPPSEIIGTPLRARAPPGRGAPIFLLNCALLT